MHKYRWFDFENDKMFEYDFTQKIPVAIYNGELEIDLSRVLTGFFANSKYKRKV